MDAEIFLNIMMFIGGGLATYIIIRMTVFTERYTDKSDKKVSLKEQKPESMIKYVASGVNIRVKIIFQYSSPSIIIVECVNNLPDEKKILVKVKDCRPYILLYNSAELSDFELLNPHIKKPVIKFKNSQERNISGERAPDLDR